MPSIFTALFFIVSSFTVNFDNYFNQTNKTSPFLASCEDSDFEKIALISKIKHGGGTSRERAQMAESIKLCLYLARKLINKLSNSAHDGLIQYLNQSFDADLLRRQIRRSAKKYAEITARDFSKFASLEKIFPFSESLKELKEISIKLEAAATGTSNFIAAIYKKKFYSKELFNQTKHRFIKAFKEFELCKSVGGKNAENAYQELKKMTIALKMAMEPEKTLAEKTRLQIEQIVENAAKLFSSLNS